MKGTRLIGMIVLCMVIVLGVMAALIATGVIDASPRKLIISSGSATGVYNGEALVCEDWELVEGELKKGHELVVSVVGSQTQAGSSPNTLSVTVVDENGADVSDSYDIEYLTGTLQVAPRPIRLMAENASKQYDGTPLSCVQYRVLEGEILQGHALQVGVTGERTEVGEAENVITAHVYDRNGQDMTGNYEIVCVSGDLVVTPHAITVQSPNAQKTYDGTALPVGMPQITAGSLMPGHQIRYIPTGVLSNAGKIPNTFAVEIWDQESEQNVTQNYTVTTVFGELTVHPRKVTIRTGDKGKDYDGTPLTYDHWSVVSTTNVLPEHTLSVVVSGTRTEVGESENLVAEILVSDAEGNDVASNYDFSGIQYGALVVRGTTTENPEDPEDPEDSEDPEDTPPSGIGIGLPPDYVPDDTTPLLQLYSGVSGSAYMRESSYGNYDGKGFGAGPVYSELLDSKYSMNYLTGLALKNAGYESAQMKVRMLVGGYALPYYLDTDPANYVIQPNDVHYLRNGGSSEYSVYYYPYSYVVNPIKIAQVPAAYALQEQAYYAFVCENYLQIPTQTDTYMQQLIQELGLRADDPEIVTKVAYFLRTSFTYNMQYDRTLDEQEDIAVAFLRDYKTGVCQHYACAGTMLFRALGIPARYTVGYSGETVAGEWTDVTAAQAHAWVEIYLQGSGWVHVEVTGGGAGGGGGGDPLVPPENPDDNDNDDDQDNDDTSILPLEITPQNLFMQYDGQTVLRPDSTTKIYGRDPKTGVDILTPLLAQGYTYTVTLGGERAEVGYGESYVESFTLYDPDGNPVNENYDITYKTGRLHVYLQELNITSYDSEKVYDGTPLLPDQNGYMSSQLISSEHTLIVTMTARTTDAATVANQFKAVVRDSAGNDVTYMYKVNASYGSLKVTRRAMTVTALSAEKQYDGTALTRNEYEITEGELCEGHTIEVMVSGSQTGIGMCDNAILYVRVKDQSGKSMLKNYSIKYVNGKLTVLP